MMMPMMTITTEMMMMQYHEMEIEQIKNVDSIQLTQTCTVYTLELSVTLSSPSDPSPDSKALALAAVNLGEGGLNEFFSLLAASNRLTGFIPEKILIKQESYYVHNEMKHSLLWITITITVFFLTKKFPSKIIIVQKVVAILASINSYAFKLT